MSMLKVGDTVHWRGNFGEAEPRRVTVLSIERVHRPGDKEGDLVDELEWELVPLYAVVSLDTGNWAYGRQLRPV